MRIVGVTASTQFPVVCSGEVHTVFPAHPSNGSKFKGTLQLASSKFVKVRVIAPPPTAPAISKFTGVPNEPVAGLIVPTSVDTLYPEPVPVAFTVTNSKSLLFIVPSPFWLQPIRALTSKQIKSAQLLNPGITKGADNTHPGVEPEKDNSISP